MVSWFTISNLPPIKFLLTKKYDDSYRLQEVPQAVQEVLKVSAATWTHKSPWTAIYCKTDDNENVSKMLSWLL